MNFLCQLHHTRLTDYGLSRNGEDEHLNTIPETESNEVIKSSVEDLVPIPSESEDTSESDSDCDLSSCNDFSPINIPKEKSVTFSNPLFDSNDDFTSSDDKSLSDKDVRKIMLKFTRTLFSNSMTNTSLVTDECFNPGGKINEIDAFLDMDIENVYHNSEEDIIYLESLLINDTIPNLPPKVFLDQNPESKLKR
ncbi:hypothetical protein Tco_0336012 [Tanacetum coccineum]